jgi:hypothetical protein
VGDHVVEMGFQRLQWIGRSLKQPGVFVQRKHDRGRLRAARDQRGSRAVLDPLQQSGKAFFGVATGDGWQLVEVDDRGHASSPYGRENASLQMIVQHLVNMNNSANMTLMASIATPDS